MKQVYRIETKTLAVTDEAITRARDVARFVGERVSGQLVPALLRQCEEPQLKTLSMHSRHDFLSMVTYVTAEIVDRRWVYEDSIEELHGEIGKLLDGTLTLLDMHARKLREDSRAERRELAEYYSGERPY